MEYGFICRKCNYDKYYNGKKPFSRRCLRCKYDESPTANTMFNKLKFSILISFHIAFKISTKKKGISKRLYLNIKLSFPKASFLSIKLKLEEKQLHLSPIPEKRLAYSL